MQDVRLSIAAGRVTCMVLRNNKMASSIQLTTGRDREIGGKSLV